MSAMTPVPYRVAERRRESADTVTLVLEPPARALPPFRPGQFGMLHAFGVGEIPVSVSGIDGDRLRYTVRAVGKVSEAVCRAGRGAVIGVRGPYGTAWPDPPTGSDILVITGGIGLAPLCPLIDELVLRADEFGRIAVLAGYREPGEQLFLADLPGWRSRAEVLVTVDRLEPGWPGHVGLVTVLLDSAVYQADRCTAYLCGPEPMMRATARELRRRGLPTERIVVSLERNMRCATGWCGHCQLGPVLLCRDGAVLDWARAEELLSLPER